MDAKYEELQNVLETMTGSLSAARAALQSIKQKSVSASLSSMQRKF